jgi:hypothetical protein
MGLGVANDIDVARPVADSANDTMWNQGSTYLYDILAFLVLDDVLAASPDVAAAIASVEPRRRDLVQKWWRIRGEQRRAYLMNDFDLRTDDLRPQELFAPVQPALCAAIAVHRASKG